MNALCAVLATALVAAPETNAKLEPIALGIISDLRKGDAASAHARLAPQASTMPPQTLLAAWVQQAAPLGKFQKLELIQTLEQQGFTVFVHAAHFEKGALQVTTAVDPKTQKVEGFFLKPIQPIVPWTSADYVDATKLTTTDVTLGEAPWELAGTLTLPVGDGPFPAVVLVHGSGPHDRDEAIGPNKPFRDLAEGLASRGIVVLRYDKRTKVHGAKMTGIVTVDDEVLSDARAAIALVSKRPEVDAKRVFVLGHSLGAQLAPEIGLRSPTVAGLVLLAPPARPACESIPDQMRYLGAGAEKIADIEQVCALMKTGKATGKLLGAPVEYWAELAKLDGVKAAKKLGKPMLILRGDRDYQVSDVDYQAWKKAFTGTPNVTVQLVPKANHLFLEGEGKSVPAEYEKFGHVAVDVITRTAAFITAKAAAAKKP